jgi:hypothetical protein
MSGDTTRAFDFAAVGRRNLVAAFDSGRVSSNGGVLPLGTVARRLSIAANPARAVTVPLRSGKTLPGAETRDCLCRLVRRIGQYWPDIRLTGTAWRLLAHRSAKRPGPRRQPFRSPGGDGPLRHQPAADPRIGGETPERPCRSPISAEGRDQKLAGGYCFVIVSDRLDAAMDAVVTSGGAVATPTRPHAEP